MSRRAARFGPAALLGLLALARPSDAATIDRVAAVVNNEVITLTEVYDLGKDFVDQHIADEGDTPDVRRAAELEVLDSLILRRLISQEITRLDLDVTEVELDRTVDDIARRNGLDRDNLRSEVEASGLPWLEYRDELRENLRQMKFTQAVIRPRITVNEDELRDAYQRMARSADLPAILDLGAIFLAYPPGADQAVKDGVYQRALELRQRIEAGQDFAQLSQAVDEGPFGAQGGKMGTYHEGDLVGALDTAAFSLDVGQTSEPVATPQGVFLLHAFDKKTEAPPAFEEVRDKLFEQVYADRIDDETQQWSLQARRKSAVVVKLEEPSGS